jgi:hypothetical protein
MKSKSTIVLVAVLVISAVIYFAPHAGVKAPVKVGANAGPDTTENCVTQGGVTECKYSQPFRPATTTICSFQAPIGTSTLLSFSYNLAVGTGTAAVIDVGTSSTPYATSTNMNFITQRAIAASALDTVDVRASTTATGLVSSANLLLSTTTDPTNPTGRTYFNVKTGAGLGGYTFGGSCQMTVRML